MPYFEDLLILLLLSLPVYFFWRWLYGKLIADKAKKKIAVILSTVVVTPLLLCVALYSLLFYICYYPKKTFNKTEWEANKEKRYRMSENFIKSKMLIGKTRDEVKAILGTREPLSTNNTWYYYMGFPPGFAIDPAELYIRFNNDKVVNAKLIH